MSSSRLQIFQFLTLEALRDISADTKKVKLFERADHHDDDDDGYDDMEI